MQRTVQTVVLLGVIVCLLGLVAASLRGAKPFIGRYISEDKADRHQVLDIRRDGTWEIRPRSELSLLGTTSSGKWKVEGDKIVLFVPQVWEEEKILGQLVGTMILKFEGDRLVDQLTHRAFLKQR